ncbi:MAG: enoyl-CoA hydratase/isomerase family protein [Ardenticatenaceae bacterium]|nr:enoyl-CoA hydratase/isomerase family protein [Ardenticatenaceae bacterium]MCB8986878.1 enoyl-CoA hydratase/isomerase family protein [Ardenticatenaceae bacterium]
MYETLEITKTGSVAFVNLNRPAARNAMNRQMVQDLLDYFRAIRDDRSIRVVVLGANGPVFCAGGDIKEMQAGFTEDEATQVGHVRTFDEMLTAVSTAPQVTLARIHGPALGGGVGLVCVTDIAVAAEEASLGLPEVQLGLVPAVISPYVVARVGLAKARQLMLTGARLNGREAAAAGLVTTAVQPDKLDGAVLEIVNAVLQASPQALAACKDLLLAVSDKPPAETAVTRVQTLQRLRTSAEGQEGLLAFVQKRPPGWVEKIED